MKMDHNHNIYHDPSYLINWQTLDSENSLAKFTNKLPKKGLIGLGCDKLEDGTSFFLISVNELQSVRIPQNLWEEFINSFPWNNQSLLFVTWDSLSLMETLFAINTNIPSERIFDLTIPLRVLHYHFQLSPTQKELWEYYMPFPYPSKPSDRVAHLSQFYNILKPIFIGKNLLPFITLDHKVQYALARSSACGSTFCTTFIGHITNASHEIGLNPKGPSEPNLYLLPQDNDKTYVIADYDQLNWMSAASLSGDPMLLKAIHSNTDLHTITASDMTAKKPGDISINDRILGRAINDTFLVKMSAKGIILYAKSNYGLNLTSSQAEHAIKIHQQKYQHLSRWQENVLEEGKELYRVTSKLGRHIFFPCAEIAIPSYEINRFRVFPCQIKRSGKTKQVTLYQKSMEYMYSSASLQIKSLIPKRCVVLFTPIQETSNEIIKTFFIDLEKELGSNIQFVFINRKRLIVRVSKKDDQVMKERIKSIMEKSLMAVLKNASPKINVSLVSELRLEDQI